MTAAEGPQVKKDPDATAFAADLWTWAKRKAIGQMDISLGARECWRILEAFPSGSCFPSHYYMAETMHKSPSAVRRYLKELKNRGYIEIAAQYDGDNNRHASTSRTRSHKRPLGRSSRSF